MRVLVLVLLLGACEGSRAPAPIANEPANVVPASAPADTRATRGYTGPVTLAALLADLLDQANAGPPTAVQLRARYEGNAKRVSTAGPNLEHPSWTTSVNGADDVFIELDGDVVGMQLHEDSRGWGAYADLAVARGGRLVVPLHNQLDGRRGAAVVVAMSWRVGWRHGARGEQRADPQENNDACQCYACTPHKGPPKVATRKQPRPRERMTDDFIELFNRLSVAIDAEAGHQHVREAAE